MTKMKKYLSILLTFAFILSAAMLVSCGSQEQETSSDASASEQMFKVTVKDAIGKPYSSGVVVRFLQNDNVVAMQPCDENGVATKSLPSGEYKIDLAFTDKEQGFYYEETVVSAEKTETDVVLSYKVSGEPTVISVGNGEYDAYSLVVGSNFVSLASEGRTYFIFAPQISGNYKVSVANGANVDIGNYGAPHYIQEMSVSEVENKSFSINVKDSMIGEDVTGTAKYVIGVDSLDASVKNCIINIERVGDSIKDVSDEPWTVYKSTVEIKEYDLPEGAEIKEFDLTASTDVYNLVFNEADGFYHLNSADGPLVLVRLTEDCDYIACFATILDRSGVSSYFYDESGNFVKKESYDDCLWEYIDCADESEGVYPLTEDLKYIIQNRGEYVGWWNPDSDGYLFVDANGYDLTDINLDIAWLLMCCYIEG